MSGTGPFDAGYPALGRTAALQRNWWLILIRGILALLFGLIAFVLPGPTIAALVFLFGIYMGVDGVFAFIAGARAAAHHERWGELMIEGVIGIVAAVIAFTFPLATVVAIVIFAAAWAVVSGVALLIAAFHLHGTGGRWIMALGGIVSVVWGLLLWFYPFAGAVVLTYWIGAYALLFGGALVALALHLRRGVARY
jgi:uncharacterized membrane protein HdeD (DUF308 family)